MNRSYSKIRHIQEANMLFERRTLNENYGDKENPFELLNNAKSKKLHSSYLTNLGDGTFVMWGEDGEWNVTLMVEKGKEIGKGFYKGKVTIDVETQNKTNYDFIKSKFNEAVSNDTYTPSKDMYKYRIATSRDFEYEPSLHDLKFGDSKTKSATELFERLLDKVILTLA
jgi:hypothetical protein